MRNNAGIACVHGMPERTMSAAPANLEQFSRPSGAKPGRRRLEIAALLVLLFLAGVAGYLFSERSGIQSLRESAGHRLDLLAAAIDSEVTRVTYIPGMLALHADVLDLLRSGDGVPRSARQQAVNHYLERLSAQHVDSLAVFVMDRRGRVVASSDWILTDNLLGADLSRRPYFQAAIKGAPYRQYAVDGVRDEPGFFFAQPIRDERQDWKIIGVAVMKASIRAVERQWLANEAPALIADGNGVVLLSAPAAWRYASLQPLSGEQISELVRAQFDGRTLGVMSLDIDPRSAAAGSIVHFGGRAAEVLGAGRDHDYLAVSRNLPGTAWHLIVFSSLQPVTRQAMQHALLVAAALASLVLWLLYLRQRQRVLQARLGLQAALETANRDLERKVAARTEDLTRTVETLEAEVHERMQAETTLRAAQEELVQAGKLAVLGQLATGITHELNQPLGAVRTLAGNSLEFLRRGDQQTAEKNLRIVCDLADQMGGIIQPLKSFARKAPATPARVDIAHPVGNALFLLDQSLRRNGVRVGNHCTAEQWFAWCDANRLQQVLINLIGNAADAMSACPQRVLAIDASRAADGRIALAVSDTGCGLPADALDRIFEPFFTTKGAGEGLGLGLAISRDIVRDFGGELLAENRTEGGARFIILLPADPGRDLS